MKIRNNWIVNEIFVYIYRDFMYTYSYLRVIWPFKKKTYFLIQNED